MTNIRLLTLINALAFAAMGIGMPLMNLYLEQLGADYATIALVLASVMLVTLVGSYLWGRLSDRVGRRKVFVVGGLAGLALAYLWLGSVGGMMAAWVARLAEGLSGAAFATLSLAIMGDELDASGRKGRQMGLFRGLGSLTFAGGALVGGRVADAFSLAWVMWASAACYLAAALVALALRERTAVVAASPASGAVTPAPPTARLPAAFLAGVFLWMAAHGASASMWPNFMDTLGYSKTTISSLWGLVALVEMPAMQFSGILSDTLGRAPLLAAGGLLTTLVQIGYITVAVWLPALVGVLVLRGLGFGTLTATSMTYTAEFGERRARGGVSGLYNTTTSAGQLLGFLMGGTLAQAWGFPTMYGVCAVLAAISTACFLLLKRRATWRTDVKESTPYASTH